MDEINVQIAAKGTELMKQGDAALKKFSITGMFSANSNNEAALEKYQQAANNYKMAKDWRSCAIANVRCAEMSHAIGSPETANFYVQAGDAMKRVDGKQACVYYQSAIDIFCQSGRFGTAAKQLEQIGEIYEAEESLPEAITAFKQAADFYSGENSTARASKVLEKVAYHSATIKKFDVAVKTFEELGSQSLQSQLLQFGAKKHFMHACFCLLAKGDAVAASSAYNRYSQLDFSFGDSREGKLCKDIADAFEKGQSDLYSQKLFEYDSITKLNRWEMNVLLVAKAHIMGESGGGAMGIDEEDGEPDLS